MTDLSVAANPGCWRPIQAARREVIQTQGPAVLTAVLSPGAARNETHGPTFDRELVTAPCNLPALQSKRVEP